MAVDDRYDVSDLPEAQFEPGSNGQVLRNRLDITSKQDMDMVEARALERTMDVLVRTFGETHRFTASDICDCHRQWLGDIYEWVGHYRRVNVSKDGFPFAAAAQVPALMDQFERTVLRRRPHARLLTVRKPPARWLKRMSSWCSFTRFAMGMAASLVRSRP